MAAKRNINQRPAASDRHQQQPQHCKYIALFINPQPATFIKILADGHISIAPIISPVLGDEPTTEPTAELLPVPMPAAEPQQQPPAPPLPYKLDLYKYEWIPDGKGYDFPGVGF
jgi:hypothetical protein